MRAAATLLALTSFAACGGSARKTAPVAPPAPVAQAPAQPAAPPAPPPLPPAPWASDPIAADAVPKVFVSEWRKAENRTTCPLLVLTDLGEGDGAKPRRATFAGGWAVAYDKKGLPGTGPSGSDCDACGRSAFGIAGAGVEKGGGPTWPNEIRWDDGSHAGYGPEGGTGKKSLAYLSVEGVTCLYNVWSALGDDHLVKLLHGIRRVEIK